jgi:hypothetical protein
LRAGTKRANLLPLMKNQTVKMLATASAILLLGGCSRSAADEGPSQADIEKLLKQSFSNADYATRTYDLKVESVQRAASRTGDAWSDGTPANKKTIVHPCKVVWTRVTTYTGSNPNVVKERFIGEYVFFRDDFGEWTFKLKDQKSQKF